MARQIQSVITEHDLRGEDALTEVTMRVDAMLEKGDMNGTAAWRRIVRAVEDRQRAVPEPDETAH